MAGTTVKHTKDVTGEKPKWWYYVVAILLILIFLFPVYILLNLSFRTIQDIGSKLMLPKEWNFQNYVDAFSSGDLWIGFKNSIILVVETVVVEIVASALAAYGLARSNGRIAESIRSVNMGIMMIPPIIKSLPPNRCVRFQFSALFSVHGIFMPTV